MCSICMFLLTKWEAISTWIPSVPRKLLLNRGEINKLRGRVEQKGYTLIPLKVYFKDSLVKVEVGLCKGKELHDKRAAIKEKENNRNLQRVLKEYNS